MSPDHNPKEIRQEQNIYYFLPIAFQVVIYLFSLALFKICFRIKFEGVENLADMDMSHGVIFASNHSSEWDGPLVRVALPFISKYSPMYYVSMEKKFYSDSGWRKILYGGHFFNMLGAYAVYSGHKDYAFSLQNHIAIVKGGGTVCIFPEGRRTRDGSLGKIHGGVAYLSYVTHAPVVPTAISGLVTLTPLDFLLFRRRVVIRFGKPLDHFAVVPQPQPVVGDFKAGAYFVMQKVEEMLKK